MNEKREELKKRVVKAQALLKKKGIRNARAIFYDSTYGSMYKNESMRIDNLWHRATADEVFTVLLEAFAKNPVPSYQNKAEFQRFIAFSEWYKSLGGADVTLTFDMIEKVYPKFKVK